MSKTIAFRAPDELAQEIEDRAAQTGQDKTAVIIEMVKGLPSIEVEKRSTLPEIEAIYLVWQANSLLYIGQTKNLREQFTSHHRLVEFLNCKARIAWFSPDGCDRLEIESGLTELSNTTTPSDAITQLQADVAEIKKLIAAKPPTAAPEVNIPPDDVLTDLVTSGLRATAIAAQLTEMGYTNAKGEPLTRSNINSRIGANLDLKAIYDRADER